MTSKKLLASLATSIWLLGASSPCLASEPVKVIEDALTLPDGMHAAEALASVKDVAAIFDLYEPVIPKVPGVKLELEKQMLSAEESTILELPVRGATFGRTIDERAHVTAETAPIACADPSLLDGMLITLDFSASSYNIERRIDRIDITACPQVDKHGQTVVNVVGKMYEGYLPQDPDLNHINEAIGAKALQSAFIKQVPAVFAAVEAHWQTLPVVAEATIEDTAEDTAEDTGK